MPQGQVTRRTVLRTGVAVAAGSTLLGAQSATAREPDRQGSSADGKSKASCEVLVIGGGAGGLHTAYRLASLPPSDPRSDVLLLESSDRLGGRILDRAPDPSRPDLVVGMGAMRVMETQDVVMALAEELGIVLQPAPRLGDLIGARGVLAGDSDTLRLLAYPDVSGDDAAGGGYDTENALYDRLRFGPARARASDFPDYRAYVRSVLGSSGHEFLADTSRFRADFDAPLSARAYLEYFDEEWDTCCTPSYPVGGMSQFIHRMADRARAAGARISLAEPAVSVARQKGSHRYLVETATRSISARSVVLATDAQSLGRIGGDVVEEIVASAQFGDLLGIPVVTVMQQWPRPWWQDLDDDGRQPRRVWTRGEAFNALEVVLAPYVADQVVTRSVYDDDIRTVEFWRRTAERGIPAVEGEVMRGLRRLFPDTDIPLPRRTLTQYWPAAWYWVRGGSPFGNGDIADWALEPLRGESVALVGESVNPQRSGWMDGAVKSSSATLAARFGVAPAATASTVRAQVHRPYRRGRD